MKVLLLENIHSMAQSKLEKEGFQVSSHPSSLTESELTFECQNYKVLGIRSKTQLSQSFFEKNPQLLAVGAFCIGTNQMELKEASQQGIAIFNAPYSNTRSVAELVMGQILALSRKLMDSNQRTHKGLWMKSAKGSYEVRGKTIGIIGYGHIGSQVGLLAESFGMKVHYYDILTKLPLGSAQRVTHLKDLLKNSDFVTLHVPETSDTKNMMGDRELSFMKKDSFLINNSRGSVMDLKALKGALDSGHLQGAAVDVYPKEPSQNKEPFECVLQNTDNVILTPHIAGSTEEAQRAIGEEVSNSLIHFLKKGSTTGSVNLPKIEPPAQKGIRILNVHKNTAGVLGDINSIISEEEVNILGQYLSTNEQVGYLIMDLENLSSRLMEKIQSLKTSLRTRVLKEKKSL